MRLRVTFAKTEAMRYTGHLDLQRAWERILRRAGLPLAYSQGFNPRPKINLAAALPLGFTSRCEVADIWLEQDHAPTEIESRLRAAAPPGVEVLSIEAVDLTAPKLPKLVRTAVYVVTLLESVPTNDLAMRIERVLGAENLMRERRGKLYDLRPLIEDLRAIEPSSTGKQRIRMRLAARSGATGRPDEVLAALGISPHNARVQRTKLVFAESKRSAPCQ